MFNIHDAHNMERIIPEHLENLLSERDQLLNRLPFEKMIEIFEAGESQLIVDKGLALTAARSGIPVSNLATFFALLFPISLVASIPIFIFMSWQLGILAIIVSIASFKASRFYTKEDVGKAALKDMKVLELLMQKGVVRFELISQK